jgi:hypothetical protein
MSTRYLVSILFVTCLLSSCWKDSSLTVAPRANPTPLAPTAVSAADAKAGFDSSEALNKLLERRWPVTAIQAYCTPERRHNESYQNLVALGVVWKGTLHRDIETGFDKIAWYATTIDGRAQEFSLGVDRGKDFWLLEIGSEETMQEPPNFSPDSREPRFVGHK